jgi:alpha-acetolactate decarboxylase
MREVMAEGATQARVSLVDSTRAPGTVGIGALAGLTGEIAIVDGQSWIARVDGDSLRCERGAKATDSATLLAIARVPRWWTIPIDQDVAATDLDALLARTARERGLGQRAWPFMIEGELVGVEAHVLRGKCPFAGPVDAQHEPIRRSFERVRGRLVGFYAPDSAGELVHHGQASHVHVIVEQPALFIGHVDAAGVSAGAFLRVPAMQ